MFAASTATVVLGCGGRIGSDDHAPGQADPAPEAEPDCSRGCDVALEPIDADLLAKFIEPLFLGFGGTRWDNVWAFGRSPAFKGGPYSTRCRWDGSAWSHCDVVYGPTESVWGLSPDRMLAGGWWIQAWDGSIWSDWPHPHVLDPHSTPFITRLAGPSEADLWAIANEGVFHWDGVRWDHADVGFAANDLCVTGKDVWVVGPGRTAHFDGVWTSNVVSSEPLVGIWAARNGEAWAVGPGTLAHYVNDAWSTDSPFPDVDFKAVWGRNQQDVWAVGQRLDVGHLYHWDGVVWTELDLEIPGLAISLFGTERDLWLGGRHPFRARLTPRLP
jgi:hypothetical protein